MKLLLRSLLIIFSFTALLSCDEESFPEDEFNVPNKDSIPVILSDTYQRNVNVSDGFVFFEPVPGPWFFLSYNIRNTTDRDLVVVILKLKISSPNGEGTFEVFYTVSDSDLTPTTLTIPANTSFPDYNPADPDSEQFSDVTIFGITGQGSAGEIDFDELIGSAYTIELQMIGYTLDENGVADENVNKRVQLTGLAN